MHSLTFRRIVLSLAGALLMSSTARSQWTVPSDSAIRAVAADRVRLERAVGMVVGVVASGSTHAVAVGSTGAGRSELDRRTIFEIGSVSKIFTTTLLAEMVERGEVRLEDPVQRYLPATVHMPTRNGKEITLLDLATATSGLPRLPRLTPADPANPYADFGPVQLYAHLPTLTLSRDPGEKYEYSNLGMGLLGHALALRAGKSYEQLVTERILRPLRMQETWIHVPAAAQERCAQGHTADLEPAPAWDWDVLAGAGGWHSTVDDLGRFLAALVSPKDDQLGRALRRSIQPIRPTGSANLSIGLGWHILRRDARTIVWHNGETAGAHAFVGFEPTTGANAIVLSNTAIDNDDVGLNLIDPSIPLRKLTPPRATVPVDSLTLDRYVGRYQLATGTDVVVTRRGVRLVAQLTGQPPFRIFPMSDRRFFYRVVAAELEFQIDASGAVSGLVLYQGGATMPGRRAP